MKPCVFCGSTAGRATDEHVIPKWARNAFDIQGWVTVHGRDAPGSPREQVGRMQHLNIVLKDGLCRACNNDWLAPIENRAKDILLPMAVHGQPTVLDAAAQALAAFWAVKTGLLLELAFRQMYPGTRAIAGYVASPVEMAQLRERSAPPDRAMVWLGCWDCQREIPVHYEPSGAELPTVDGAAVAGHFTTFTLGFVAFQVFTVDPLAAEQHGADVWNTRPPEQLRQALPRIWPPQLRIRDVQWPPAAFANADWRNLVTWAGVLQPGT